MIRDGEVLVMNNERGFSVGWTLLGPGAGTGAEGAHLQPVPRLTHAGFTLQERDVRALCDINQST